MEAEKQDERLPPAMATVKRTQRRVRKVSSRYMIPPSPRSAPSSPIHPSSTPSSFRNQFQNHKPRIPSPDVSDSESEPSSRYADENQDNFFTPSPLRLQGKAQNIQKRFFSHNTSDISQTHFIEHHKGKPPTRVGTPKALDFGIKTPIPVLCSQTQFRSTNKTAKHRGKSNVLTPIPRLMPSTSEKSCSLVDSGSQSCNISSYGGLCDSPPIRTQGNCRVRQSLELWSSMPEASLLSTSSRKSGKVKKLRLRHSHNSALSICQPNPINLVKAKSNKTLA